MDQSASKASLNLTHCFAGGNPLSPDLMTADERLTEVAQILSAGLVRLRQRHFLNHNNNLEKNSLDFSSHRSGHATAGQQREVRR